MRKNTKPVFHTVYVLTCTWVEGKAVEKMLVKKLSKRFDILNMADNCLGAMLTGKVVHQYAKTGEYLQTFANSNQAYISTGVKDSNILRCCQRVQGYGAKSAGGFLWSFVKYDHTTEIMEITFSRGDKYMYWGVPVQVATDLLKADSIGKFFHKFINKKYETKRV